MLDRLGPIDQMVEILLQRRDHRYALSVDHERRVVSFTRGGMQAWAEVAEDGLIRVDYESAPHEVAEEFCSTPGQGASLVEAVMAREHLCRVPKPELP